MEARINTDKIKISKPVAIEGQLWFHVDVPNGWDDVKKIMTKVIEVNNIDFTYTGWNSDKNIAYFTHNKHSVGLIKN